MKHRLLAKLFLLSGMALLPEVSKNRQTQCMVLLTPLKLDWSYYSWQLTVTIDVLTFVYRPNRKSKTNSHQSDFS